MGIFNIYTPEEINSILRLLTELGMLIIGTSVGTFTRELIFPKDNTFGQNVGFSLIAGFLSFGVMLRFEEVLTIEYTFLLCVLLGFFVPVFKDYLKGKKLFQIILKVYKKGSKVKDDLADVLDEEFNKEEEEED